MDQLPQPTISLAASEVGPVRVLNLKAQHQQARGPAEVNIFQVGDTLIDAGFYYIRDTLIEALKDQPPKRILLTHHHEDHIANLQALRDAFGEIPVYAPRQLMRWIAAPEPLSMMRTMFWGPLEPFTDLIPFDPGEVFVERSIGLEAVETPGHCPYHCGFVFKDGGRTYALSGDLYYRRKPLVIWHESNADDAIASCRMLADLDPELMLMPTHVPPAPDGVQLLRHQADWIEREADRVRAAVDRLGTRDYGIIAEDLFGPHELAEQFSEGQLTRASFVRSVLDPVKTLPAERIHYP